MHEALMHGKMLWFNADKGFGFIQTEADERLYVATSGFAGGDIPMGRCAGRDVTFERHVQEGDIRAIGVSFLTPAELRRARSRQARGARTH
jgi:cold shock CspA family protein